MPSRLLGAPVPIDPTPGPATGVPGGLNSSFAGDVGWVYFGRPLLFVLVVGVVLLLLRWVFTPERPTRPVPADRRAAAGARDVPSDYGLLVPVATVPTEPDARALRDALAEHGIRGTLAPGQGGVQLLVFPADAGRARAVVAAR